MRTFVFTSVTLAVLVFVANGTAKEDSRPWPRRADSVCKAWKARTHDAAVKLRETMKPLAQNQSLTHEQWSYWFHTSLILEVDLVHRLDTLPGPVPRLGRRALFFINVNEGELATATKAFDAGKMNLAMKWLGLWMRDDRADPVWRALGATHCI